MKKAQLYTVLILLIFISGACNQEMKEQGSRHIVIFDHEHLHFNPEKYKGPIELGSNDLVRIADGRILLKKLSLPVYERVHFLCRAHH